MLVDMVSVCLCLLEMLWILFFNLEHLQMLSMWHKKDSIQWSSNLVIVGGRGGGVFLFVCFFCCTKQFNLSLNIVIMVILSGNFVLFWNDVIILNTFCETRCCWMYFVTPIGIRVNVDWYVCVCVCVCTCVCRSLCVCLPVSISVMGWEGRCVS